MTTNNTNTKKPVSVSLTVDDSAITITHPMGEECVLIIEDLPESIRHAAMLHGLKQKIGDAAAIPRCTETGASATPEEKFAAMSRVMSNLRAGEWFATSRGEGSASRGGLLLRAMIRMAGVEGEALAVLRAKVGALSKKEQADLRGNARVAAIIAEIKAEDEARTTHGESSDKANDLLAGILG